ncbi:hypothetical protein [Arthrobacter sp. ZBG10]|uniref:hypothetical protein n=1 Tax=Arthrobacter sp. ZBG10 TaxID=1676590 RepID=UPI000B232F31|nr:hypothetical protein [Arthrobacter sp. ZBG10]
MRTNEIPRVSASIGGVLGLVSLRKWAVVVLGLSLTAMSAFLLAGVGRTYGTTVELLFVEPGRGSVVSGSDAALPSLVDFAGIVQQRISEEGSAVELPSSTATLYGSGVRNGYSITLPNTGTQWAVSFSRPVLAVQVVGPSPQQVRQTLDQVMTSVELEAQGLQGGKGVPPGGYIQVTPSPAAPVVVDLGSTKLGRTKATLVIGLLGLTLTAFSASRIDRWLTAYKPRWRHP